MGRLEIYQQQLRELKNEHWDAYLLSESGLPGRRANIELARAVAIEGEAALFERYLAVDAGQAPANTAGEFLAFCGVLGLGRLIAAGERPFSDLRPFARDPRWRLREATAMALQTVGQADLSQLEALRNWADGGFYDQRAAAAGLCAPEILVSPQACTLALDVLDVVTEHIQHAVDRQEEAFRVARKGMAYCWSVAVAACPEQGRLRFEYWLDSPDKDVRWIMRENLKKKRLSRLDEEWVKRGQAILEANGSETGKNN